METLQKNKEKINALNEFMHTLQNNKSTQSKKQIYEQYQTEIKNIKPSDLFYLDAYKQDTQLSMQEIKKYADKFVNVFYQGLVQYEITDYSDPFFAHLYKENKAIETHLDSLKQYYKKTTNIYDHKEVLISGFESCLEIERKFLKKENILFPKLETNVPSTKPLEVMWELHDDARRLIKQILTELKQDQIDEKKLMSAIGEYYFLIYGINQKEQLILYPVATKVLDSDTLQSMFQESFEYGYAFIEVTKPKTKEDKEAMIIKGFLKTKTGALNANQLQGVFNSIPLDITFVDNNDKVVYFNDRKERHFPRNPSIIGRLVKHCHPPKSVHIVTKIVAEFKQGNKDKAEFWISFNETFLYITYYAVRDNKNNYLGVLEVSQDVTHIRSLKGENRLLDWK